MRDPEVAYWNNNFKMMKENLVADNIWKRQQILIKLLAHDFIDKKVLEIGVGFGSIAFILKRLFLDKIRYIGTDVSTTACNFLHHNCGVEMVHADITNLPRIQPDGFDFIIALDVLEHINPEDRELGYNGMHDTLSQNGKVLINNPLDESGHDNNFDYGLDDNGIKDMCLNRFEIDIKEPYSVMANKTLRNYEWIEMRKI